MILNIFNVWQINAPVWFDEVVVLGVTCSDHGCGEVATFDIAWPGRNTAPQKCTAHRDGWAMVADVMGFELVSFPRPVRPFQPPREDDAALRFAMMELDR